MAETVAHLFERLAHFAERAGLWWGLALSLFMALASLAVALVVVLGWPADHFKHAEAVPFWGDRSRVVRLVGLFAKNAAGAILLVLGLLMALPGIPGQGIVTMIIGLTLVDFPGKRSLERRLIGRPSVLSRINRARARFKRAPLQMG